ncbi:MAG: transposase, partial [Candidatus Omnitrophota bacterium]
MPRVARIVLPGYPHHITHRGNYKQVVFEQPDDYIFYSNLVKKYFSKYGLKILSYV